MSIAAFPIAARAIAEIDAPPATRRPPGRRTVIAKPDRTAAPEAR